METAGTQPQKRQPAQKEAVFLMAAARNGNLNKVRDLIEKQHYEVDMPGDEAFTALHCACAAKKANVVEYLVQAGANVFEKNAQGDTPYDMAKALERKEAGSAVYAALHGAMLTLGECKVCFEGAVSLYTLPCSDQCCVECIRNWFRSLLDENDPLKCPSAECQEMAPDEVQPPEEIDAWRLLTRDEFDRHSRQSLQRLLCVMKDFQFCTRCPSGGFIAHACMEVCCLDCPENWCRKCRLPPHSAHTCEEFQAIYAKDLNLNLACMKDNCKKCPACRTPIERDGGCSHIKCSRCKFEFCWWCRRKYTPGVYTFEEDGDCPCPKDDDDNLAQSGGWA